MLCNRIKNKSILKKILTTVIISVSIFAMGTLYYQNNKINELENNLYLKEEIVQRKGNYTEGTLYSKTIETKFNELKEYKIFDGKINRKHKYVYEEDYVLGLHKKSTLTATCDIYYESNIRLSSAIIKESNNEVEITLTSSPYIKEESVHRIKDTMNIIEDESSSNLLCGNKTGMKVMKYWEDSLDDSSYYDLVDYYSMEDKKQELEDRALKEVESLVKVFVKDKKIIIKF